MKYVQIPFVSQPVSRIVLGCAGGLFASGGDIAPVMEAALSCGINAVDTARVYGQSEETLGRWMQASGRRMVLISKGCHPSLAFLDRVHEKAAREDLQRTARLLSLGQVKSLSLALTALQLYIASRPICGHLAQAHSLVYGIDRGYLRAVGTAETAGGLDGMPLSIGHLEGHAA